MAMVMHRRLMLPSAFRARDVLAIHQRDPASQAESVQGQVLDKGLVWQGLPARLRLRFTPRIAQAELVMDAEPGDQAEGDLDALTAMLRRMLCLHADIDSFEERYKTHAVLGPLLRLQRGAAPACDGHAF